MNVASAFAAQVRQDLLVSVRRWGELANPLLFFAAVTLLFPLAIGPETEILARISSGIIWVAALFALLLGQDSLFRPDFDDGMLEQLFLSPYPSALLISAKMLAHWIVSALPLVLLSPLLAIGLSMPGQGLSTMMFALLLGTPTLLVISSVGAALTVGLSRGGLLLSILVLPLVVPVIIFGARATDLAASGESAVAVFYLLGALLALAITMGPLAITAALRISLD